MTDAIHATMPTPGIIMVDSGFAGVKCARPVWARHLMSLKKTAPVADFMRTDPLAVTLADTTLTAGSTMRDHQLTWLPVLTDHDSRHLVGCLKPHTILAYAVRHLPA